MSSATGVRVQEPAPLTPATPFVATLMPSGRSTSSSSQSKAGKKRSIKDITAAPHSFLCSPYPAPSPSPLSPDQLLLLTVQGAGLYVYNMSNNQQCIHSFSVPPSVGFATPATMVRREPAAPAASTVEMMDTDEQLDDDGDEDMEDVAANFVTKPAKKSELNHSRVYVAIETSPDYPTAGGKVVWLWDTKASSSSTGPGRPKAVGVYEKAVRYIYGVGRSDWIVLVFEDGSIGLSDGPNSLGKLVTPLKPASSKKGRRVVWSSQTSTGGFLVVMKSGGNLGVRLAKVVPSSAEGGRPEMEWDGPEIELVNTNSDAVSPLSFSFYEVDRSLGVAFSNGDFKLFSLKGRTDGPREPTCIVDLKQLNLSLDMPYSNNEDLVSAPSPIAVKVLPGDYFAVVGSRATGNSEAVLSIWDSRYGIVHLERSLSTKESRADDNDSSASTHRCFEVDVIQTAQSGPILCVAITESVSLKPLTVSSSVMLVPFFCPPLTLLSAIGKLHGNNFMKPSLDGESLRINESSVGLAATVADTPPPLAADTDEEEELLKQWSATLTGLEIVERTFVTNLIDANKTSTVKEFAAEFRRWIFSKLDVKLNDSDVKKTEKLPIIPISQPSITAVVHRIVRSHKFYPAKCLQYLLKTGRVSNVLRGLPDPSATLLGVIMQRSDLGALKMAIKHVSDISETEVVRVLQFTCESKLFNDEKGIEVGTGEGREWMFENLFEIPRNNLHMARAMRVLSVANLEVLMKWVMKGLKISSDGSSGSKEDGREALCWFWDGEKKEVERFEMAVDVLSLIIDSHLTTILLTQSLQMYLTAITRVIKEDAKFMSVLQRKMKGPLAMIEEGGPQVAEADGDDLGEERKKEGRQRWKKMIRDLRDGVGRYSVETFAL